MSFRTALLLTVVPLVAAATGVVAVVSYVYDRRVTDRITATVPRAEVMDLLREQRAWHLVLVLLLMALSAAVAAWLGGRIARPLRRLQRKAHAVAEGGPSAAIPEEGPAELRALAADFNRMAAAVAAREADLTKANAELARSQAVFRNLFDHTSDLVTLFRVPADGPLICEAVNPAVAAVTGMPREQVVGKTFYTNLPEDEADFLEGRFREAVTTGKPVAYERTITLGSGERWFSTVVIPLPGPAGRVELVASVSRDMTERRKADQALQDSEAFLAGLIESATDAIVAVDDQDTVLMFNAAAEKVFGVSADQAFGRPVARFLPDGLCGPPGSRRVAARRGDGDEFTAEVSVSALEAAGRRVCAAILRDVSGRAASTAELERRVADRTAQLAAANRELESFAYSVSHDLRAPLRAIDGFAQAVREDYADRLDDAGRDYLDRIRQGSQQMGELIDDLLALSRATRGELRPSEVNLSELAGRVVDGLRTQAPDRSVTMSIQPGLTATGDPNLLRVVLDNLLGNAWKYTGNTTDARVEFGMADRDGERVYFVRDNGAGYDPTHADKLFEPFQRLHRPDEFGGHGIGLATVRRVVGRHGGRTWAEGAVGQGATVYFTLGTDRD